jgi:hypothetical protein
MPTGQAWYGHGRERCAYCRQLCRWLCDFQADAGPPCGKPLCGRHRTVEGDQDVCPAHAPPVEQADPGARPTARHRTPTAVSKEPCQGRTTAGAPCRAFAPSGGALSRVHDPERQAEVQAARSRGAANAAKARRLQGRRRKLTTPAALLSFVDTLIWDAIDGKYDPRLVNAIVGAVNVQRALIEVSDLEQRLAALEAAAGQQQRFKR